MNQGLGKRITSIDKDGIPKFSNAISTGKWVGEIQLVKEEGVDVCNLCRNKIVQGLSEDHVPPKCMGNKGKFHYVNYLNFCTNSTVDYYGIFNGGIKYKTVCEKCNNEELYPFDVEIDKFVRAYHENKNKNNNVVEIECKPQLIIKGLIGHFLAASLSNSPSTYEMQMLAYFWDNKKFHDNVNIYLLHYNDQNLVSVLREVIFTPIITKGIPMTINCLKCYPFAFFQVMDGRINEAEDWNQWLYTDGTQLISIDTTRSVGKWFPELFYPVGSGKLLGHNSVHSVIGFREKEELPNDVKSKNKTNM